jgi:hypothetical protein
MPYREKHREVKTCTLGIYIQGNDSRLPHTLMWQAIESERAKRSTDKQN